MDNEFAYKWISERLANFVDPLTERALHPKQLRDVSVAGDSLSMSLTLGYPWADGEHPLAILLKSACKEMEGIAAVNFVTEIKTHAVQKGVKPYSDIKNIIAVASGKGGVGKSTVTTNLALALSKQGASVGILDADIFGPSQPTMMGSDAFIDKRHDEVLDPVEVYGVQTISAGYLVRGDNPIMWRGPMVSQALDHLMNETYWADLDYLLIDMPPGTGDVQLSLAQEIPVTGAVIVTTPQDIALLDARKALVMFQQMDIEVLGVVENMSVHVCESCGHEQHIFGEGGGSAMAKQYGVECIGQLPLDIRIRQDSDRGCPTVVADPEGGIAKLYTDVARTVAAKIANRPLDYSGRMPEVKVQC